MPDSAATPLRHRLVRWADPEPLAVARRAQSGLEFFRGIASGALPQPPIYDLLGFRITGLEPGSAHFEGGTGDFTLRAVADSGHRAMVSGPEGLATWKPRTAPHGRAQDR